YMLTQFPGGYFGDRYGHRSVVLISIFWAGVTTLCTGLVGGLIWFVALRILTGLGEGAFYSNDRTLVARVTPPEKLGFGMGLVITGLTTGLTIAFLVVPPLINWAVSFMKEEAWRMPFLVMSIPTFLVWAMMTRYLPAPAAS
ncbi:MAG: MFS transporter, partial [Nitrospiraceae bacterium]